jgi:hypothetical protein
MIGPLQDSWSPFIDNLEVLGLVEIWSDGKCMR